MRVRTALRVLTFVCASTLAWPLTLSAARPSPDDGAVIRGRVLDDRGEPVAGITVLAGAPVMGQTLWWAQETMHRATTDRDGRFELPVPCGQIIYSLSFPSPAYSLERPLDVMAGEAGPLEIRLTRGRATRQLAGTLQDPFGAAAAGVEVRLVGEYGFAAVAQSGEDGAVRFRDVPDYIGQAVLMARAGDLVLPQNIVRAPDKELPLTLCLPGTLAGEAVDAKTGEPVSGVSVLVTPWFSSGVRMEAKGDARGRWTIDNVPPGRWRVALSAPTHFDRPPRGGAAHDRVEVEVREAAVAWVRTPMRRSATVRGLVVGPDDQPVRGALVAMPVTYDGDYRDQNRYVRSDPDGRFEITTGHTEEAVTIAAFSASAGWHERQLDPPLKDGEARDNVTLKLSGAARVRGTVVAPDGTPVAGVRVSTVVGPDVWAKTDDKGRFDLGRVATLAGQGRRPSLRLEPPRPAPGVTGVVLFIPDVQVPAPPLPLPRADEKFYAPATREYDAAPGGEVDVRLTLDPTDLLTFDGRVTGKGGAPVAASMVFLFAGNADETTWVPTVRPRMGSSEFVKQTSRLIASGGTDADGRYRIYALRSDSDGKYSVGVIAPDDSAARLVHDVTVAAGERGRSLAVELDTATTRPARPGDDPKRGAAAPGAGVPGAAREQDQRQRLKDAPLLPR